MTTRKNRITGTEITVARTSDLGLDPSHDGKWTTLCEDHGNNVTHRTKKLAIYHSAVPEWCYDCAVEHFDHTPDPEWAEVK